MRDSILVLNSGSSSIKFRLFEIAGEALELRLRGVVDGIGVKPRFKAVDSHGLSLADEAKPAAELPNVAAAMDAVISFLRRQLGGVLPVAIGHRVVHGGTTYSRSVAVDDDVLEELQGLVRLAPLHQPGNIAPIRAIRAARPSLLQVACFDTAFHRTLPDVAERYAIPEALYSRGVRKFGFHGLSYEYIASQIPRLGPALAERRVIVAHLGSGASMCAMRACRSIETTMGYTAVDGLPMGTRSGQIDPGVVLQLLREGMSVDQVERFLYHECGLRGLSGISNDLRELLASKEPAADLAVRYFVHRVACFAGMLAGALGGVDGFIFTAGIGENAPGIRRAILDKLAWMGIRVDERANEAGGPLISQSSQSSVACYVVATNEELMIARHTLAIVRNGQGPRHGDRQ